MPQEIVWVWAAVALYAATASLAIAGVARNQLREKLVLGLLVVGASLMAAGIAQRWARIGHGPFFSMYEVLTSNIFSLSVVFAVAYWRLPVLRAAVAVVLPVLLLMGCWLLVANPVDTHFPPTYATPWLWIHLSAGKLFLGTTLVAVGVAGVTLLRRTRLGPWFARMPQEAMLDELTWRLMMVALTFESFMLIAGAVWAQDAWGRYWSWDPLETWAFLTWLTLVGAIHLRVSYRIAPRVGAALVLTVFVLAFLTFFGVPFLSMTPHKGAV